MATATVDGHDLYKEFIDGARSPSTRDARGYDLGDLGKFLGLSPADAVTSIVGGTRGHALETSNRYVRHLRDRGVTNQTINRRISTIRSLVKLARVSGSIEWALDVDYLKCEMVRSKAEPIDADTIARLVSFAEGNAGKGIAMDIRDLAILRLLCDEGLGCSQVVAIDVEDIDVEASKIAVTGLRVERQSKRLRPIGGPTCISLSAWLRERRDSSGPAFIGLHNGAVSPIKRHRLSSRGVWRAVERMRQGAAIGQKLNPRLLKRGIDRSTISVEDLKGRPAPLVLRGEGFPPLVYGREVPRLTGIAYALASFAVERFHQGGVCAGSELAERTTSTSSNPIKSLTLKLKEPGFEPLSRVLIWDRKKGGTLRIIDPGPE